MQHNMKTNVNNMKILNMSNLLIIFFLAFSCTSSKDVPISIEHAECLYEYSIREYYQKSQNKNAISIKDCEANWKWEINDGWNICKEERFAYKIEYNEGNSYVINTFFSSTGTGEFTHLFLLEIKDGTFNLIESIAGGDRCQYGLISEEVEFKDNLIYYSELITPFHLMSWTGHDLPFGSYDDCMICCCGAAKYKYNPISKEKEFIGIELLLDEIEGNDNFSKTYNLFLQKGKKFLQEKEIIEFIKSADNE